MSNHGSDSQDSSLYFLSTQIQARHEDQEHKDSKLSQLRQFKNAIQSSKFTMPKPAKVTKPKRKSTKNTKNTRQINSISAFVRETLGGKKAPDAQSLLDRFLGDQKRLDTFLSEVELATATPHLLSKKGGRDSLFSGPEWKQFSETLTLRNPNLSSGNKKSLKIISKRLDALKQKETDLSSQDSIWSEASRQPSDSFSADDLKWLYDLDEDQLKSETSICNQEEPPGSPICVTLSQAVGDPSRPDGYDHFSPNSKTPCGKDESQIRAVSEEVDDMAGDSAGTIYSSDVEDFGVVPDSEPEIDPLSNNDMSLYLFSESRETNSAPTFAQKSSRPWQPEFATTSLVFASTLKPQDGVTSSPVESPVGNKTIAESLTPTKSEHTAFNTPSCLRIDSSPIIDNQRVDRIDSSPVSERKRRRERKDEGKYGNGGSGGKEGKDRKLGRATTYGISQDVNIDSDVFLSAQASLHGTQVSLFRSDSESLQFSPLKKKRKPTQRDFLEVAGKVELDPSKSSRVHLSIIPSERYSSDEIIPDSEDEQGEYSVIEITKEDDQNANISVLQVPSSPEIDQLERRWEDHI